MNLLVRAALLGASAGARTFTGFALLTLTTSAESTADVEKVLARPVTKAIIPVVALGEIVADKLPVTPSRTQPPAFAGRVAVAGLDALLLARRSQAERDASQAGLASDAPGTEAPHPAEPTAVDRSSRPVSTSALASAVGVAVLAASAVTLLGPVARGAMARAVGVDWVGAVVEDALAVGLAWAGARG